jgi:Family of unknown function (DUF6516)
MAGGAKSATAARYSLPSAAYTDRREDPAVLYDNDHPKGHHRHIQGIEEPYEFVDIDRLISDFTADVVRVTGARE